MKLKKGDTVIVTAGKDRGKTSTIIHAFPKKGVVILEGVNVVTRHQKSKRRGTQGQLVEKPMPINVSNVALKDGKTGKPTRIGYTIEGEGEKAKKVRVAKKSGTKI